MKTRLKFLLGLIFALSICANALTSPQTFEAKGIFIMGENDTRNQAREFALQDAKRLALEQAGTYLQSTTQVINGQVAKDEILTIASGVIKLERILSEELKIGNNVMSCIVKASFVIDKDDLQKKIDNLKQSEQRHEEVQKIAELRRRYEVLLAENNAIKNQLSQATEQNRRSELLSKSQEVHNQLIATQCYDRGYIFYKEKDYDSAIAAFSQAIALDLQYINAYYNRGNAYASKGLYDLAIGDFSRVIAINPQDDYAYNNRGTIYANKGLYDLAISDFSNAISVNSQHAAVYYNRGLAYYKKGLYGDAMLDFNSAIIINPQDADSYLGKAVIHEKFAQPNEAIEAYRKFLQYAPAQHKDIIFAKNSLAALESR